MMIIWNFINCEITLATGKGNIFLHSPSSTDLLWGFTSLQFNDYLRSFLREKDGWGVKLIIRIHLTPKLRMAGALLFTSLIACPETNLSLLSDDDDNDDYDDDDKVAVCRLTYLQMHAVSVSRHSIQAYRPFLYRTCALLWRYELPQCV